MQQFVRKTNNIIINMHYIKEHLYKRVYNLKFCLTPLTDKYDSSTYYAVSFFFKSLKDNGQHHFGPLRIVRFIPNRLDLFRMNRFRSN
jgi:hypothetical protein